MAKWSEGASQVMSDLVNVDNLSPDDVGALNATITRWADANNHGTQNQTFPVPNRPRWKVEATAVNGEIVRITRQMG